MPAPSTAPAPIYDQLVDEQGDVLTVVREAAQETERTAEDVLDFGHGSAAEQGERPAEG
ncbi:hypothetical protein [Streptomyces sp. VRA16 Mangrove soil]|uniref:hypothetical protein n=1 Tax=Streptomyces sp. VRA16 Mangrove soil TaxID=2817434 RepID=UPI001A9D9E48|nr:hypothetical protein [Streptomyces sp. VRA16 Mangrove soil]MBO1330640.1 hypothetical protein [Streptomyces sp. VRA16 Mangrove soil]